jgi:hypothetical protein
LLVDETVQNKGVLLVLDEELKAVKTGVITVLVAGSGMDITNNGGQ